MLSFDGAPHGGRQRHLPEWQSQPRITPTTIIDHSIVGSAEGAFRMFRDTSALESHFIVDLDGEIWQLMDTSRQADANLRANDYAISIETADRGSPDTQPWTVEQLASLVWLHEALLDAHQTIPRRRSRSCADPGGLGYHTLHGAPSCWTPVAKSCPGRVRKGQWADVLLPAFLNPAEDRRHDPRAGRRCCKQIHNVLFKGHPINNAHPIDNLYQNADRTHDALVVPGATTAEESFNLLFARVRPIEDMARDRHRRRRPSRIRLPPPPAAP